MRQDQEVQQDQEVRQEEEVQQAVLEAEDHKVHKVL